MKSHRLFLRGMAILLVVSMTIGIFFGTSLSAYAENETVSSASKEETALMTEKEETTATEEYVSDETTAEANNVEETISETIVETTEIVSDNETDLAKISNEAMEKAAEEVVSEETVTAVNETVVVETTIAEPIVNEQNSYGVQQIDTDEEDDEAVLLEADSTDTEDIVASGTCGENVSWAITGDENEGYTLTISGNGDMYNYRDYNSVPWYNYYYKIKDIELMAGVTSIGNYAFYRCEITRITIPESVASIGNYAFYWCQKLISITIPENVTSIGEHAFYHCSRLTSIAIPEGVTSIGSSAFSDCSSLISVTIPKGVTSLGNYAFGYCDSLTDITIPESVTSIGAKTFYSCSNLHNFHIDSIKTWLDLLLGSVGVSPRHLYMGEKELTEISIPEGVISIGEKAFLGCSSLTSIIIPKGVTSIGDSAFRDCNSLTDITIPEGVTSTGSSAFYNCSNLSNFHIDSVKAWLDFPLGGYGASTKHLFMDGKELTEIIIPEGMTNIRDYAFFGCCNLTSIVIPEGVTRIGYGAFSWCINLQTCYILGKDVLITNDAFNYCDNVTIFCPEDSNVIIESERIGIPCITDVLPTASEINKITNAQSGCVLQWEKSSNATGYYIYKKTGNGSYALANTITSAATLKWTDTSAKTNGTKYTYYVVPFNDVDDTIYEGARSGETVSYYVSQPTTSSITPATNAGLKVTWTKNDKATGYYVYRKTGTESYKKLATITNASTLNWTDNSAKTNGVKYTYCVVAYKTVSGTTYRSASNLSKDVYFVAQPTISSVAAVTNKGLKVTWDKNAKANGYYIYRKTGSGSYSKVKTITSGATVTWTDTAAKTNGTSYTYYVVAYKTVDGATYQSTKSATKTAYYLSQSAISSIASVTNKGLKVIWSKNTKASGYYIYRKTGSGNYSKVKTITNGSTVNWTDTGAKTNGTGYTYYVIAYKTVSGVNHQSDKSAVKSYYFLSYPTISSLTSPKARQMLVKWGKNAKATGYVIQYSTSSTFASGNKTVTVKGVATVSKTITSLTAKKRYYVRIRTYKTVSGKNYYSAWSAVKNVTIK